jgi:hypothetical protein
MSKLFECKVRGEYFTHSNGGRDRMRFEDVVYLPEELEEDGYLYAAKQFITREYKENNLDFRRLRTMDIVEATDVDNPKTPITHLDLMSLDQLKEHAQKRFPKINLRMYYENSHKSELRQAIRDFIKDPTSAEKHQEWKAEKNTRKAEVYDKLAAANQRRNAKPSITPVGNQRKQPDIKKENEL